MLRTAAQSTMGAVQVQNCTQTVSKLTDMFRIAAEKFLMGQQSEKSAELLNLTKVLQFLHYLD